MLSVVYLEKTYFHGFFLCPSCKSAANMLLESIYHYCQQIERYVERFGDDYSTFCADFAYYEGVTMNIMQLGEKAGRLSEGFRERTKKQIPWQIIRGTYRRDRTVIALAPQKK